MSEEQPDEPIRDSSLPAEEDGASAPLHGLISTRDNPLTTASGQTQILSCQEDRAASLFDMNIPAGDDGKEPSASARASLIGSTHSSLLDLAAGLPRPGCNGRRLENTAGVRVHLRGHT